MKELTQEKIRDLSAEYFLHDLDQEDLKKLEAAVLADDGAKAIFSDAARDEWLIHNVHHYADDRIIHFAPRRKRRHKIQAIAASAAILVSLGTLVLSRTLSFSPFADKNDEVQLTQAVAEVADLFVLEGDAVSVVNSGRVEKLSGSSVIRTGDRIVVPPGARLIYRYLGEDTLIEIEGNSLVEVSNHEGAKRIHMSHGELHADVAKQTEGKPMRVSTRHAEAVVLGTSFSIIARDVTRLSVTHGRVRFTPLDSDESVEVGAGRYAETGEDELSVATEFVQRVFLPVFEKTLNLTQQDRYIAVDPERNYKGLIKFDLEEIQGEIIEARLRLHVVNYRKDYGGSGDVRLFRLSDPDQPNGHRSQISAYRGRVGGGMDLEFEVDPSALADGINSLLIVMDKGGNDFWFSSSKGVASPRLELKVTPSE